MKETAILFTGAGFTHNFGTPLAEGIWAEIFNNEEVQNSIKLRNIMLRNFDYESIYYEVLNGDFTDLEKDAIKKATYNAYENLDQIVRDYKFSLGSPYPINIYEIQKFINKFFEHGANHLFTLNQDLFLERKYYNGQTLIIPGIRNNSSWFKSYFNGKLNPSNAITLPDEKQLAEIRKTYNQTSNYNYIKLHGSQNWISYMGNNKMVIGKEKEKQIKEEPLLNWYFEIFEEVLYSPNILLLIIGYSFSDKHINNIIANAILKYKLKLYILMPLSPDKLKSNLIGISNMTDNSGNIIWNGIHGFFPYKLLHVFPADQSITHPCRELYKYLFKVGLR